MFKLDGMLMIGSAGANVGKTELACTLIKKFGSSREIVGIKVTTIKAKDGRCPRGGRGCGVCSSLDGDFCITQETNLSRYVADTAGKTSGKDTGRLLAAGASRVFWLRVLKRHLQQGVKALLDIIGPDAVSVCETNSLREVVKPGLFLIIKGHNGKKWKSSAGEVKEYADKIIVSDNGRFGFDLGRIKLTNGKWVMQENATAIILAGGASDRMGVDKSMLPIKGRPMIERISEQLRGTFSQILISANEVDKYSYLGFEVVPDKVPYQGPLMGIASALEASANELNFVAACDIPSINIRFVRRMLAEANGADMVIPATGDGKYEPLFAVYCKNALIAINEVLSSGGRKISDVFGRCKVKYIKMEAGRIVNINTMAEYEEFQKKHDDQL